MTQATIFLPPRPTRAIVAPWLKSFGIAAVLGVLVGASFAAGAAVTDERMDEELGAEMLIEIAPVVASAASLEAAAAPEAPAEDRPPTPEVDEVQSKKVERDLPTEQASPMPPEEEDLRMAQEKTQREKEEAAEEEQATEAMKGETAVVSSQATQASEASEAVEGEPEREVASAPDHGNSATARRRIEAWQRKLFGHIARHKIYPEAARKTRATGETVLAFRIARDGKLSNVRIVSSSGSAVLDDAALDVMRRASPAPALPMELQGASLEFSLPMKFSLK